MIDKSEIYKWWHIFKRDNELVEIRFIGNNKTASGYYKNIENLLRDVERMDAEGKFQIYFTLNCIEESCYGREQCEKVVWKPKNTTTDNDIKGRYWILIDLDPKRPSGTSSSNEEYEKAHYKAVDVYRYLMDMGFYEPVVCSSGNGWHLLLPCKIGISTDTNEVVNKFLKVLSMLFSDESIDIDVKVGNPARICKLYGTMAKKGTNIPERPHRMARIVKTPTEIKPNNIEYFKKIAELFPEKEQPSVNNNWKPQDSNFDLDEFITKHNIPVTKKVEVADGTRYYLEHCLFNPDHKGKDAILFKHNNGAVAYYCYHNSCQNNDWRKVREMYEPDAYQHKRNDYPQGYRRYDRYQIKTEFTPQEENEKQGKKWLSMKDVKYLDISQMTVMPTGYNALDRKIMGLLLGDVSILSGLSGAGKTSWLDCIILNVIERGFKVGVWSGELQDFRFQSWIDNVAAGKNHVVKNPNFDNLYYTPSGIAEKINSWLDGKLFLYNNNYKNRWKQLFEDIQKLVDKEDCKLIVLDNLMALNISDFDGTKNEQQSQFINEIKEYAKQKNIHVILVCHPRKQDGFLRKESISGTADLTNLCDNLFILHRVGRDFRSRAAEFFGENEISKYINYDTVVEVCKNRMLGVQDYLVGMYYEYESRRLKNEISEHIKYGWEELPRQTSVFAQNDYMSDEDPFEKPFENPDFFTQNQEEVPF